MRRSFLARGAAAMVTISGAAAAALGCSADAGVDGAAATAPLETVTLAPGIIGRAPAVAARALSPRAMAASVEAADADLPRRKRTIVTSWVMRYGLDAAANPSWAGGFDPWTEAKDADGATPARVALLKLAAGLHVVTHPQDFGDFELGLLSGLPSGSTLAAHKAAFRAKVNAFAAGLTRFAGVGTGDDFDFYLREIISIVYLYRDAPDVLSNEAIFRMLTLGEGAVPFAGQNAQEYLYKVAPLNVGVSSETENHVLMISAWRYLAQNYLEWVAGLPAAACPDPAGACASRYDARLAAIFRADEARYRNTSAFTDDVLKFLGRVAYAGLFETNARPYETYSLLAIAAFHSFADALFQDAPRRRVKTAAQNALDYLAANFAFQSLEGRRHVPMRRKFDYRDRLDFYNAGDHLPTLFGALSGAYVFDDWNGREEYPTSTATDDHLWHFGRVKRSPAFAALWASLYSYRVPRAIHDFMLHKYDGYWARMQSRFTRGHYRWSAGPLSATQSPPYARYFDGDVPFAGGSFAPVKELYFVTNDFVHAAGGKYSAYQTDAWVDAAKEYHALAKPTALIPRGYMRFRPLEPSGLGEREQMLGALEDRAVTLRGQMPYFFDSKNLGVYKGFAYGYVTDGENPRDMHTEWPQRVPPGWDAMHKRAELAIGRATFKIYDFAPGSGADFEGHYLVMAKVSKHSLTSSSRYDNYARGFVEIVPRTRFPSWEALRDYLTAKNPASHFTNDLDDHYRYTMTTGERLTLERLVGASGHDGTILEIRDAAGRVIPPEQYRFREDYDTDEPNRSLPLMSVWQTNRAFTFTGYQYAYADGKGRIEINNPHVGAYLRIDASKVREPSRAELTRDLDAVTAFTEPSFGGAAVPLTEGWYGPERLRSLGLLTATGTADLDALSIPRHNDFIVIAYDGADFTGARVVVLASDPRLGDRVRAEIGAVRSLAVVRAYDGAPRGPTATVFHEAGLWGKQAKLSAGRYTLRDLQELGVAGKNISSVRLDASGVDVVLYEQDFWKGASLRLTATTSSLVPLGWNDRATSIEVVPK